MKKSKLSVGLLLIAKVICLVIIHSNYAIAQCSTTYTDTINKILHDGINCMDYPIVNIGTQWWTSENSNATLYANGTALVDGTGAGSVSGDYITKYYFNYNNDSINGSIYGKLYTWAAIMNGNASSSSIPSGIQGVCPTGWHIPSDGEWKQMELFLGMTQQQADAVSWRGTDEGNKLKEAGIAHWADSSGASNSTGYTAIPGGCRSSAGSFTLKGLNGYWWSSTESSTSSLAVFRSLKYSETGVNRSFDSKAVGFSVRCIKDIDNQNSISSYGQISRFEIFPIPNSGTFNIIIEVKQTESIELKVTNILGQEFYNEKLIQFQGDYQKQLDFGDIPSGIYNFQIINRSEIINKKIIID